LVITFFNKIMHVACACIVFVLFPLLTGCFKLNFICNWVTDQSCLEHSLESWKPRNFFHKQNIRTMWIVQVTCCVLLLFVLQEGDTDSDSKSYELKLAEMMCRQYTNILHCCLSALESEHEHTWLTCCDFYCHKLCIWKHCHKCTILLSFGVQHTRCVGCVPTHCNM